MPRGTFDEPETEAETCSEIPAAVEEWRRDVVAFARKAGFEPDLMMARSRPQARRRRQRATAMQSTMSFSTSLVGWRWVRRDLESFFADPEEAERAARQVRAFNVIYMPMAFKFDLFPARVFALGIQGLDRAILLDNSGLSAEPVPFVTPQDIVLAKLSWFRPGGEVSEVQWRDVQGIVHGLDGKLDYAYLSRSAETLGIADLLKGALV